MRKILLVAIIGIILFTGPSAFAGGTQTFLLWSPGGEGSSEQAEPLLATWVDYLKEHGLADHKLKAVYNNESADAGLKTLKKLKPAAAIISLETYLSLHDKEPVTFIAQTRKQPADNGWERYRLLQRKGEKNIQSVQISEPLNPDFVTEILLKDAPASYRRLPIHYADQVLAVLKAVGNGERSDAVLVSDYQAAVLDKIPSPWRTSLETVTESPLLPAPAVVIFDRWKDHFPVEVFVKVLLAMDQNEEGKEILQELRLSGFMKPDPAAYQKWQRPEPPLPPQ